MVFSIKCQQIYCYQLLLEEAQDQLGLMDQFSFKQGLKDHHHSFCYLEREVFSIKYQQTYCYQLWLVVELNQLELMDQFSFSSLQGSKSHHRSFYCLEQEAS